MKKCNPKLKCSNTVATESKEVHANGAKCPPAQVSIFDLSWHSGDTVLLLIHFQNNTVHPNGKFYSRMRESLKLNKTVSKVAELVPLARRAGLLIAHNEILPEVGDDDEEEYAPGPILRTTVKASNKSRISISDYGWGYQIIDDLTPKCPPDIILVRTSQDWANFDIESIQSKYPHRKISNLVIAGVSTNGSVRLLADMAKKSMNLNSVVILSDGCAASSAKEHYEAIQELKKSHKVVSCAVAVNYLKHKCGIRSFYDKTDAVADPSSDAEGKRPGDARKAQDYARPGGQSRKGSKKLGESPTTAPPIPLSSEKVREKSSIKERGSRSSICPFKLIASNDVSTRQLVIRNELLGAAAAARYANALISNNHLTIITFISSNINAYGAACFGQMLTKNNVLLELTIENDDVLNAGACLLADGLKLNSTLELLALNSVGVGDIGANRLADALIGHPSLLSLYLQSNVIQDEGARAIASALNDNIVLQQIHLDGNKITDGGTNSFCNALTTNKTLKNLSLVGNPVNPGVLRELERALKRNN